MAEPRKEVLSDGVEIWLGDCRDVLPLIGRVDAVVTDPPYGIGFAKGDSGRRVTGRRLCASRFVEPIAGDDQPFDPSPFLNIAPEIIIWGADHFKNRLPDGGRLLAWDKRDGWDFRDSFSDVEFAWHNRKRAARVINYLWKGVRQAGEKGLPKYHIMQKPIEVMAFCIRELESRAEAILDPFMGSGTTGVACIQLGRRFIGVELDPRYFDIARRRLEAELAKPRLPLDEPAPQATQEALL